METNKQVNKLIKEKLYIEALESIKKLQYILTNSLFIKSTKNKLEEIENKIIHSFDLEIIIEDLKQIQSQIINYYFSNIYEIIAKDEFTTLIDELRKIINEVSPKIKRDFLLLSARYNRISNKMYLGMPYKEEDLNAIRFSFIKLVQNIEKNCSEVTEKQIFTKNTLKIIATSIVMLVAGFLLFGGGRILNNYLRKECEDLEIIDLNIMKLDSLDIKIKNNGKKDIYLNLAEIEVLKIWDVNKMNFLSKYLNSYRPDQLDFKDISQYYQFELLLFSIFKDLEYKINLKEKEHKKISISQEIRPRSIDRFVICFSKSIIETPVFVKEYIKKENPKKVNEYISEEKKMQLKEPIIFFVQFRLWIFDSKDKKCATSSQKLLIPIYYDSDAKPNFLTFFGKLRKKVNDLKDGDLKNKIEMAYLKNLQKIFDEIAEKSKESKMAPELEEALSIWGITQ